MIETAQVIVILAPLVYANVEAIQHVQAILIHVLTGYANVETVNNAKIANGF